MSVEKVAVVTGANKGIGFAIVKGLYQKFQGVVYLTARNVSRGKAAVGELNKLSIYPEFHQLDITDKDSIKTFADFIKNKHGGLDILINNAGVGYMSDATEPFSEQAEISIKVNYFALLDVCNALFPLLRPHARVVNLSSSSGCLSRITGKSIQIRFLDPNLTEEKLSALMKEFVESAKSGDYEKDGWGTSAYVVSKVAVTALTFLQHKKFLVDSRQDIVVNAVHPGYTNTDMNHHRGHLTIEQGADAPIYLALLPPNVVTPRGEFVWKDKRTISWTNPPPGN